MRSLRSRIRGEPERKTDRMSTMILITVTDHILGGSHPVAVAVDTDAAEREMDRRFAEIVAAYADRRGVHVSEISAYTLDRLEEANTFTASFGLPVAS